MTALEAVRHNQELQRMGLARAIFQGWCERLKFEDLKELSPSMMATMAQASFGLATAFDAEIPNHLSLDEDES